MAVDVLRAKELLAGLADGVNPLTGEVLSDDDSCNQAEIVRALHVAVQELDKAVKRSSKPLPENAGKPWSSDEERTLVSEYRAGQKGTDIAKSHQRSKEAVAARLVRLGEISDRYALK